MRPTTEARMTPSELSRRALFGGAGLWIANAAAAAAAAKPRVLIKTGKGAIVIELETARAPITCANFMRYVDASAYDGGTFWRANRTLGAPKEGSIEGSPPPRLHRFAPIAHESTTTTGLRHKTGSVSLARYDPGTATADFFICASPEPYLDAHPGGKGDNLGYAVFGEVVAGMDVVRAILALHTVKNPQFPKMTPQIIDPAVPIVTMRRVA
jgi:peptidyl-prolyl cis-trans isomerase A (cyclophilin A)